MNKRFTVCTALLLLSASLLLTSCINDDYDHTIPSRAHRETEEETTKETTDQTQQTHPATRYTIDEIADIDWAVSNSPDFDVSTPEQFAGVVKFVNEKAPDDFINIRLMNDLDLDDYEWEPMNDFTGNIDGNWHVINNIHLNTPNNNHNGIIGNNGGPIGVFNLSIRNAEVNGGEYAGIILGEGYMLNFENVYASGTVVSDGEKVGALIGRCSPSMIYDSCSMDVTVNGEEAEYFSYTQEHETHSEDNLEKIYTLTLRDDHTVVRSDEDYDPWNLTWRIIYNGDIVLERLAEHEFEYKYFREEPGTYIIYLTEYSSSFGGYVRISNMVEYEIP